MRFQWWVWLNENGSGLGALAAVAAAVVAIIAIVNTARDTRARSQPAVTAEFRIAPDSDSTIELVLANSGSTVARNVSVRFDPPITIPKGSDGRMTKYLIQRYASPVPVLSPQQQLTNIWWSGHNTGGNELTNSEPTPDRVTVHVAYDGLGRRRLKQSYPLNIETIQMTTLSVSSTSFKGRLKSIDQSLNKIAKATELLLRSQS